ncbi:MAG: VanZ family protein [Pseudorhodoplanes sp.]
MIRANLVRLVRLGALVCVVLIAVLSLTPREHLVRTPLGGHVEHIVAYMGFAFLCLATVTATRSRVVIFGLLVAYAGLLEYLQIFVPGRHSGLNDFAASATGILFGALIAILAGPHIADGRS